MASAPRRLRKSTLALQGRLRVAEEELRLQRAFVAGLERELAAAEARLLEVRRLAPMFIHTFMMYKCVHICYAAAAGGRARPAVHVQPVPHRSLARGVRRFDALCLVMPSLSPVLPSLLDALELSSLFARYPGPCDPLSLSSLSPVLALVSLFSPSSLSRPSLPSSPRAAHTLTRRFVPARLAV